MLLATPAWQQSNRHKLVVISDLHFPRKDSHPKYLYEFLINNPSDMLVILGDFFEGYGPEIGEFGEWHKRCLDLVHQRRSEEALQVIVIPGNHDQYLRDERVLDHFIFGTLYRPDMVLDGHGGKRTFLTHGDAYDARRVRETEMFAFQTGENIKISRVSLSELYNYYIGSSEKRLKTCFEKATEASLKKKFREGIAASAKEHGCNAVLCGHTHAPQPFIPVKGEKWLSYGNTGSFTGKLATAMVLTQDNNWKMVNWKEKREKMGLDILPHRDNENPAAAYRDLTEMEITFHKSLQSVWISHRLLTQAYRTIEQIKEFTNKIEDALQPKKEELERAFRRAEPKLATVPSSNNPPPEKMPAPHHADYGRRRSSAELTVL